MERAAAPSPRLGRPLLDLALVGTACLVGAAILVGFLALFEVRLFDFAYLADSRTWAVVAMWLYLAAALVLQRSNVGLGLLATIPIITQFYQVVLGWDVEGGALSPMRVAPLVVLLLCLLVRLFDLRTKPSATEALFLLLWIPSCLIWWSASVDLTPIGISSLIIQSVLLPAFYFVIKDSIQRSEEAQAYLGCALGLGFVLLCVGTLFLVVAGTAYRAEGGAGNLVTSRNVADVNFVMGYLMLLWPFALLWRQGRTILTPLLGLLLLVTAVLSFSRGAMVLVPIVVVVSLILAGGGWKRVLGQTVVLAALVGALVALMPNRDQILGVWTVRLFDIVPAEGGTDALVRGMDGGLMASTSGRPEIWSAAWALFRESPIWGHGFGSFQQLGPGFAEAHSILFHVLAEQGVLGLLLVYWFFLALAVVLWTRTRAGHDFSRRFSVLLLTAFGAWLLFNHTVASALVVASEDSFQVNAIAPLLLTVYLSWRPSGRETP